MHSSLLVELTTPFPTPPPLQAFIYITRSTLFYLHSRMPISLASHLHLSPRLFHSHSLQRSTIRRAVIIRLVCLSRAALASLNAVLEMAETHAFTPLVSDATPAPASNASTRGGPDVPDVRAVSADSAGGARGGWQLARALVDAYDDRPLATIGALSPPASARSARSTRALPYLLVPYQSQCSCKSSALIRCTAQSSVLCHT